MINNLSVFTTFNMWKHVEDTSETIPKGQQSKAQDLVDLRWLNTVLAVCEYMSFAKSWQEKGCSSRAETWQVKNILIKDFD